MNYKINHINFIRHLTFIGGLLYAVQSRCQIIDNPKTDSLSIDSSEMILLEPYELTEKEKRQMEIAVSDPAWFFLTQIASVFNIGVYYSYIQPIGKFQQKALPANAFSADLSLNLSRAVGHEYNNIHWLIGLNMDFFNFGKVSNNVKKINGDTTTTFSIKNRNEVISWYLEISAHKHWLSPFASVAYSTVFINPYLEEKTVISNATTNYKTITGDYISNVKSHGVNLSVGFKAKYSFNTHKALMLLGKVSYLNTSPVEMIDLTSVTFNGFGIPQYSTQIVQPNWLTYTLGLKYNF